MSDSTNSTVEEERQFRERMEEAAAAQNLPAGAVPEQRPQTIQQFPESQRSQGDLERQANPEADQIPMGREEYDRAASPKQAAKAEKTSALPSIKEGEVVKIVDHETNHFKGRVGVVTDVHYTPQGAVDARSGNRGLAEFAQVDHYVIKTRDEGNYRISVRPEQIEAIGQQNLTRTVN